jgi:hypothetical protein
VEDHLASVATFMISRRHLCGGYEEIRETVSYSYAAARICTLLVAFYKENNNGKKDQPAHRGGSARGPVGTGLRGHGTRHFRCVGNDCFKPVRAVPLSRRAEIERLINMARYSGDSRALGKIASS